WLATFFGIFLALAIAFVMIWIAYKPQVRTSATEQTEQAGVALAPSPSATPETLPSSAESAPVEQPQALQPPATQEPEKDNGGGDGGDKGGGGGGESKKPAKPAVKPVVPAQNILLRNTTSHMCAELPGREKGELDGPVQQAVCDDTDGDNQIWNLEVKYAKAGPGGADLFQIRNIKDQYCMDLPYHGAVAVGTPVTEFKCDSTSATDNQFWWVDKQESGAYWIRNFSSNQKCLGVEGANGGALFSKMVLDNCSNVDDQEWEIIHPKKG
ncbi:hydrogenase expression protein, partial [Streptomyces sp. SID5926]|nr:hydrogenase expression protein [Streptomyces sp. SID5926]